MILSCGSLNMDLITRVAEAPAAGETVLGSDYEEQPGGKGGNQAVAAARLGVSVRMLGAVGGDGFGESLLAALRREGVETRFVRQLDGPSGAAFITVDQAGENRIVVAPGANSRLTAHLDAGAFRRVGAVLIQLEIPLAAALAAARLGREAGALVILNAAPAVPGLLPELQDVDVLVVNEVEAAELLEVEGPATQEEAMVCARRLAEHVPQAVITLGSEGAAWCRHGESAGAVPAYPVAPVDSTGAGDAFVAALGVMLAEGAELPAAVRFASVAGALATTGHGAQAALPERQAVQALF